MNPEDREEASLGEILRATRVAKGLSQQHLAVELQMPVQLLAAMEADDWPRIPPGRERPLARRVAKHLKLDLTTCPEAWKGVPGEVVQEAQDPKRERIERILTGLLSLGSLALLFWLVIPARNLKGNASLTKTPPIPRETATWSNKTPATAFPVLGEVLPDAPITEDGILVSLRAMDTCTGKITANGIETVHTLRVSEPWILRVKGAFTLSLDNAGVVTLEVAGRRINQGGAVGEAWTGSFDEEGRWLLPIEAAPKLPLHVPQSEAETHVEE